MHKKYFKFFSGILTLLTLGVFCGCDDQGRMLTVGAGKMYATIQEAVDAAQDGDVILIYPGTYTESVCVTGKTLTLQGTDREACILQYPNGDYLTPPLEMGSGKLLNMTLHATAQMQKPGAIAKAYALHIDYSISRNNTFTIEDVTFVNDDYQTVGIGLREAFTLRFKHCSFICKGDKNAFYCHDDPTGVAAPNQQLIVDGCYFENNGTTSTIMMQSQEQEGSDILCLWTDNEVVNKGVGKLVDCQFWNPKVSDRQGWLGMSFWENSSKSSRNTVSELNA